MFKKGNKVLITYEGRTIEGVVEIASENQKSIGLSFETVRGGHVGRILIFRPDDHTAYRNIMTGVEVTVKPAKESN